MKIAMILITVLFTFACGDGAEKKGPSKTDIKKRVKDGDKKDYCEEFNWYGDGTCDEFCIKADSDCGAQNCKAQPVCDKDYIEVKECADGVNKADPGGGVALPVEDLQCKEVSICGTTIFCQKDAVSCTTKIAIEQKCPKGYQHINAEPGTCPKDRTCKTVEADDGCGGTDAWVCLKDEAVQCGAVPTCGKNEFWVRQCRLHDTNCKQITLCGTTISCATKLACKSLPTCAKDELQAKAAECDKNVKCRETYICSTAILCKGAPDCKAPICEDHQEKVEFEACKKGKCEEVVGCGESILCKNKPI